MSFNVSDHSKRFKMVLNLKFKIPTTRVLFKSLKNARGEWKSKTPMQKWCYFYGIGKTAYSAMCVSLLNDVNKVHWFGYFTVVYSIAIPLLSLYTICYYAYHGQIEKALPSTCMASIAIGVSLMKIVSKSWFNQTRHSISACISYSISRWL